MVAPNMQLAYGADDPGLQQFGCAASRVRAGRLDARFGDDILGFEASGADLSGFADRVGDRFGAVDVLAELQSGYQNDSVRVIGRADDQRVEVLVFFVEHLAKVTVARSLWISFEDLLGVIVVDVAQRGNVLVLAALDISLAHAAYAHGGDPKLLAGRLVSRAAQNMSRDNYKR